MVSRTERLLSPPQKLWLERIYSNLQAGKDTDERIIRIDLLNQIPSNFDPYRINPGLIRGATQITLLGIALIAPDAEIVKAANEIIKAVRKILTDNPKTQKVAAEAVSELTDIRIANIEDLFQKLAETGLLHKSGLTGSNGWSQINVDTDTFNNYFKHETIEEWVKSLLSQVWIKVEKEDVPEDKSKNKTTQIKLDIWTTIHPEIIKVSKTLFESNHYADSVLAGLREVNAVLKAKVKTLTGEELDGAKLMQRTFSVDKPILLLGDTTTQTGQDIQQGYQQIFSGAIIGIRNPKSHENLVIDENQAIHLLFLASLLMNKIDEATEPKLAH